MKILGVLFIIFGLFLVAGELTVVSVRLGSVNDVLNVIAADFRATEQAK